MTELSESTLTRIEKNKEKIGSLLVKHTQLTNEQLNEALRVQRESGSLIGEILLKKNFIQPHDIVRVICVQMHIPYLEDLKVEEINPDLIHDISINYAREHQVLPLLETDFSVTIAMSDPFDADILMDLHTVFKKEIISCVAAPIKIHEAINRVYEKANKNLEVSIEDEFEENLDLDTPIDILDAGADEAPVIRFVNSIIFRAVKEKASDIHIEPYERETIYRFRINGVMQEVFRQPIKTHAAVSSRIKVMAKLNIAEKRLPQDGRIKIRLAGKDIDIRLSTVPVQNGERLVMRLLETSNVLLRLEKLGFHGEVLHNLDELTKRKHGVVYVTGPTGHGKTTTLFALLDRINSPDRMIITVEDPVEYEVPGISQIQVNHKIDLSFAAALRSILRQNPDVIMVGETRDFETAEMAINASLTGHFVLSTLHTNDAASAPTRLIDMGVQPFLISSSLIAVLAQRLVRTLCEYCKTPHKVSNYEIEILGINDIPPGARIFKANGCPKCSHSGFSGRTSVCELMLINDEIRALILKKEASSSMKRCAVKNGMVTLRQDALIKLFKGFTSVDEIVRAINSEEAVE